MAMTDALLESLTEFPDAVGEYFDTTREHTCCVFNRRGTLLATGTTDGTCMVWDFTTRTSYRTLEMSYPVISLSWSRNGRVLLAVARDESDHSQAVLTSWDVLSGKKIAERCIPDACNACIHPIDTSQAIVMFDQKPVAIVSLDGDGDGDGDGKSASDQIQHIEFDVDAVLAVDAQAKKRTKPLKSPPKYRIGVFDKLGTHLFLGGSDGALCMFSFPELKLISAKRRAFKARIMHIGVNRTCTQLLVRAGNTLGLFSIEPTLTLDRDFIDGVNRYRWDRCAFGGTSDYVFGVTDKEQCRKIYVWNMYSGALVKVLDSHKFAVLDIAVHPVKATMITCCDDGRIAQWQRQQDMFKWISFVPDFHEISCNITYTEREDEFDIDDKDRVESDSENEELDIVTADPDHTFSDVDDELVYLPVADQAIRVYHQRKRAEAEAQAEAEAKASAKAKVESDAEQKSEEVSSVQPMQTEPEIKVNTATLQSLQKQESTETDVVVSATASENGGLKRKRQDDIPMLDVSINSSTATATATATAATTAATAVTAPSIREMAPMEKKVKIEKPVQHLVTILHNPKCSKSRQTLALLQQHNAPLKVVLYLQEPPDPVVLRVLLHKLKMTSARELVRSGETVFKELNLGDPSVDEATLLAAMCKHPILIQRPIVVCGEDAVIGRPPENVLKLLSTQSNK
jgi:COMPASS component SWD1